MPKIILAFFLMFTALSAQAVEFKFADAEKAREIVLAQDAYFNRMSPAEIAIRLESEIADKSAADLKSLYGDNFLDWQPGEIEQFRSVIAENRDRVEKVAHLLPETVWFIRGTDKIEGGLPHTHANAIIIQDTIETLSENLFFHELFHVLTRHNHDRRENLYGLLGFEMCHLREPADVSAIHLTNPDVPFEAYYLPVEIGTEQAHIIPFLYAAHPAYNPAVEGGFGGHFGFGLLEVGVRGETCSAISGDGGASVIHPPGKVPGYFEAIGRNTDYIIHAEEILASNFVFLMTGKDDLPNPEIPGRLEDWLMQGREGE